MGVKNLFTGNAQIQDIVEAIVQSGCFTFHTDDDQRVLFTVDFDKVPPGMEGFIEHMAKEGMATLLELTVQGHAFHEGLKVVTLNQLDAEALENTVLNFPASEYNQPFPTLFVDLPTSFFLKHEVDCPQGGEFHAGEKTPDRHYPHTVGLRHYKDDKVNYIVASIYFTSNQVYTFLLDTSIHSGTLEESIQVTRESTRQLPNSAYISKQEGAVTLALRVALNTVLILESEGMRTLGPSDPNYYNRLEGNVRKARKRQDPEEKIQRAERVLRAEPIFYTFDQNVIIYQHDNTIDDGDTPHESTGRSLRPHWRSGYHRMQHYGVGNLQRKRVRIPSVMVNKHKFVGKPKDTSVTYEVRK